MQRNRLRHASDMWSGHARGNAPGSLEGGRKKAPSKIGWRDPGWRKKKAGCNNPAGVRSTQRLTSKITPYFDHPSHSRRPKRGADGEHLPASRAAPGLVSARSRLLPWTGFPKHLSGLADTGERLASPQRLAPCPRRATSVRSRPLRRRRSALCRGRTPTASTAPTQVRAALGGDPNPLREASPLGGRALAPRHRPLPGHVIAGAFSRPAGATGGQGQRARIVPPRPMGGGAPVCA